MTKEYNINIVSGMELGIDVLEILQLYTPGYSTSFINLFNENIFVLGSYCFYSCRMNEIILPNTLIEIKSFAFEKCTLLNKITLPSSIKIIEGNTFYGCTSLNNITYNGTVEQWNQIELGYNWNYNVPATYVQCSDGQVQL